MATRRLYRNLAAQRRQRKRRVTFFSVLAIGGGALLLQAFQIAAGYLEGPITVGTTQVGKTLTESATLIGLQDVKSANGRPQISPLPQAQEVWECDVVVLGGTLGGVAAANHAMQAGAQTCLIELTPWLGGQVSSQGVSAIDESRSMRQLQNFSDSWREFKRLIRGQPIRLPGWTGMSDRQFIYETNSCWVGSLCFLPRAGANAAEQFLQSALAASPKSRWATSTAFKGAAFDTSGRNVTAVYAVQRTPKNDNYLPRGRLSQELYDWYAWSSNELYDKKPIRLQPPSGQRMIVIDATDTGEFVAWAQIPFRVGSDGKDVLNEPNAPVRSNPACTQAFTYPFIMAIVDDDGGSKQALSRLETGVPKHEHRSMFGMEGFPMFHTRGLFNYRRVASRYTDEGSVSRTTTGELSMINWTEGNDWNIMDEPLVMTQDVLTDTGQYQNWMGGLSIQALKNGENHALLFAEWLIDHQATDEFPLTFWYGPDAPMWTQSGLSMVPYIREGRRIIGRPAYGQEQFMMIEQDLRVDIDGGREFAPTAIAMTHYDIDIHGCRWRNWAPSYEATRASVNERLARPLPIPLEALVPIGVDNLLIGGKSIAGSHIVNAMTRVHYGEWSVGAAAGATAGWLTETAQPPDLTPAQIVVTNQIGDLQNFLIDQGLRYYW
ncbi:MAG: FAD-dependent oxidoreductase [Cyanobacteria bacterium P01_H01_bin.152]